MLKAGPSLFFKVFNILASVVGIMFVIVGAGISIWGISLLLQPSSTIALNGVQITDVLPKILVTVLPLLLVLSGVLLIKARRCVPPAAH